MKISSGAELSFLGTSVNDPIVIEGKGNIEPRMTNGTTFDEITIENAIVKLDVDKNFTFYKDIDISWSTFTNLSGSSTSGKSQGVRFWGTEMSNINVFNNTFENANNGLDINLVSNPTTMSLLSNDFLNCDNGLYTEGKGVTVVGGEFKYNNVGWKAMNMSYTSNVEEVLFEQNFISGLDYTSQNEGTIAISESQFFDNGFAGLFLVNTESYLMCNEVRVMDSSNPSNGQGNNMAIYIDGAELFMNDDGINDGAFNNVYDYNDGILLSNASMHLLDGYNDFTNNGDAFSGTSPQGYDPGDQFAGGGACLNADNNIMPLAQPFGSSGGTFVDESILGYGICYNNANPTIPNNPCGALSGIDPTAQLTDLLNGLNVSLTTDESNCGLKWACKNLNEAIISILEDLSTNVEANDNLTAITNFEDMFASIRSQEPEYDIDDLKAMDIAYHQMLKALGNAYSWNQLSLNDGGDDNGTVNSYLQKVIDEIDYRIANADVEQSNYDDLIFEFKLDKAHMYRMSNHFDYGLAVLNSEMSNLTTTQATIKNYWVCVLENEKDLVQETIDAETFAEEAQFCSAIIQNLRVANLEEAQEANSKTTKLRAPKFKLQPNPTSDNTSIIFDTALENDAKVILTDISGNLIGEYSLVIGQETYIIERSNLSSGIYFITIQSGNFIETQKLVFQ